MNLDALILPLVTLGNFARHVGSALIDPPLRTKRIMDHNSISKPLFASYTTMTSETDGQDSILLHRVAADSDFRRNTHRRSFVHKSWSSSCDGIRCHTDSLLVVCYRVDYGSMREVRRYAEGNFREDGVRRHSTLTLERLFFSTSERQDSWLNYTPVLRSTENVTELGTNSPLLFVQQLCVESNLLYCLAV